MNPKSKAVDIPWDHCMTLLEWCRYQWIAGHDEIANSMVKTLPESARPPYREVYAKIKKERKGEG